MTSMAGQTAQRLTDALSRQEGVCLKAEASEHLGSHSLWGKALGIGSQQQQPGPCACFVGNPVGADYRNLWASKGGFQTPGARPRGSLSCGAQTLPGFHRTPVAC